MAKTYKPPSLLGSTIATQQYTAKSTLPKEQDYDAELFKGLREDLGPRPKGWASFASGLTRGLEYGSKLSALESRKQDLADYNEVMDYFSRTSQEAEERNQWYERREQAKTAVLPEVMSYVRNFSQYDPVTREKMFNMALNNYNNIAQTDLKLLSLDGSDPLKAVVSSEGQVVPFNILDAFGGDEMLRAEAATHMPAYQMKLQEARQQQEIENSFKQQQLALQQQGLGIQQYNADTSRMGVTEKLNKEKAATPEQIEKDTYLRLYDLLSDENVDPTIGAGTGVKNWAAQNVPFAGSLLANGLAPQQEYQQLLADLKGLRFKRFGYRNQAEFNKIKTLDETLPKEQAKEFVANELKKAGIDVSSNKQALPKSNIPPSSDMLKIETPLGNRYISREQYNALSN